MNRRIVIAVVAVIIALAIIAFIAERKISPPVKDVYFVLPPHTPPNLVVIRPAHFVMPASRGNYWQQFTNNGKPATYISGRGVTLKEMIGAAYESSVSRIIFPSDMPTNQFDYLVTVAEKTHEELQAAIKSKFGYMAHRQKMDMDVLALKVETPNSPNLITSTNNNRNYIGGKLTHFNVNVLVWPLENRLQQPVMDETGLTNFYDFRWNFQPRDRPTIDKQLTVLGLRLEPKTESLDMLIVEKAH